MWFEWWLIKPVVLLLTVSTKRNQPESESSPQIKLTHVHSCLQAYQVLSNEEKRRLYDSEGHAAFQQDSTPADPMDEQVDDLLFTFTDLFHGSDCPFSPQPSPHWTLNDFEDEDDYFSPLYSFDSYNFVEDENEDLFY